MSQRDQLMKEELEKFAKSIGATVVSGNGPESLIAALKAMSQSKKGEEKPSEEENCFCSQCLRYENFEEMLGGRPGQFSGTAFNIGDRIFDVVSATLNSVR